MTGRGLGYCAGYSAPGFMHGGWGRGFGRGWGRGWGRGMGWGRGFGWQQGLMPGGYPAPPTTFRSFPSSGEVRSDLEAYRDELKRELEGVEEELSGKPKTK